MSKSKGSSLNTASNELYAAASDTEHSPKRVRLYSEEDTLISEEEYEEAVQALQDEYINKKNKKGSNHKVVKELMEKTKKNRHKWIREDRPMITEVVDKFPVLRTSRWVG